MCSAKKKLFEGCFFFVPVCFKVCFRSKWVAKSHKLFTLHPMIRTPLVSVWTCKKNLFFSPLQWWFYSLTNPEMDHVWAFPFPPHASHSSIPCSPDFPPPFLQLFHPLPCCQSSSPPTFSTSSPSTPAGLRRSLWEVPPLIVKARTIDPPVWLGPRVGNTRDEAAWEDTYLYVDGERKLSQKDQWGRTQGDFRKTDSETFTKCSSTKD